jgi:hypothetical protein
VRVRRQELGPDLVEPQLERSRPRAQRGVVDEILHRVGGDHHPVVAMLVGRPEVLAVDDDLDRGGGQDVLAPAER